MNLMVVIALTVGTAAVVAETPAPILAAGAKVQVAAPSSDPRVSGRWEMGPFVNFGSGVGDRTGCYFFAPAFQVGRTMTPIVHAGPLTGRFEYGVNVLPLWQAYTPAAHTDLVTVGETTVQERIGGGTFTGASVTPVVFRWNLAPHSHRFMPWGQASAGVLYTTHKFPPTIEVPEGTPGGTSVFNFRSGGGVGLHYFTRPRRSVDFLVLAEHISSASLGDRNPGVNASVHLQVGYTWWK
jgi:lipid A 3-O-deacylase